MAKQTGNGQPARYNASNPTFVDGEAGALNIDVNGALKVHTVATDTSTAIADGGSFTPGSTMGTVMLATVDDVASTTVAEDKVGAIRMTPLRDLHTVGGFLEISFTTTIVQAVGTTDVGNYKGVSVQITTQGTSSTVTFQTSNDNSTWTNQGLVNVTSVNSTIPAVSSANPGTFTGNLQGRYFRLNVTGISAGTTAGIVEFFANPLTNYPSTVITSLVPGTGSTNIGKAEDASHTSGDTGVLSLFVRNDTLTAQTNASADYGAPAIDAAGRVIMMQKGTPTKTNVAASATSTTVIAANSSRAFFWIYNDSSAILYLDETGGTASTTSFTTLISPNTRYEPPCMTVTAITGIWASATGNARVTEFN